ncbi:hypothetical protein [Altererythrobacter sp.]|nr:hypothetical protein [Altererythrobacter sp.]MBO6608786.1 hypothetical protein [Altererythrobacter sp.]MBO6640826.1 hypothetical protein [Altererythrobacter sp.]MBO6708476.1 hypothetical protein [Altererythrobacter sp.]
MRFRKIVKPFAIMELPAICRDEASQKQTAARTTVYADGDHFSDFCNDA